MEASLKKYYDSLAESNDWLRKENEDLYYLLGMAEAENDRLRKIIDEISEMSETRTFEV